EGPSDEDSAVSSAPASLSPQPLNEMWELYQTMHSRVSHEQKTHTLNIDIYRHLVFAAVLGVMRVIAQNANAAIAIPCHPLNY
ncbi:hypothetical protein KGM_200965B, partial [Danaus plexippus plexippus]